MSVQLQFALLLCCGTAVLVHAALDSRRLSAGNPLEKDLDGMMTVRFDNGDTPIHNVTGLQNYEFSIPMPHDAHFMIGSNSKLFTAVAIYQLQEEGKLSVSADIATMLDADDFAQFGLPNQTTFCPRLPGQQTCQVITLQLLLSMSSGLYPSLNCNWPQSSPNECNVSPFFINPGSIAAVVGSFINNPLAFVPGTQYLYSNPNFVLASYFVQKYSGMKFGAYLKKNIFDRLSLNHTYWDFFDNQLGGADPKRAYEYFKFYDNTTFTRFAYGPLRTELDTGSVAGTGGLISHPFDVQHWYRTLFNRTTGGAPLFTHNSSQKAILYPWILSSTAPSPIGTLYFYYTQGVVTGCLTVNCTTGVDFIVYEGGTLGTHTANVYHYRKGYGGAMSQVWTSSLQQLTTRAALHAAQEAESGPGQLPVSRIVIPWQVGTPNPIDLTWYLMFRHGNVTGQGGLSHEASKAAINLRGVFPLSRW